MPPRKRAKPKTTPPADEPPAGFGSVLEDEPVTAADGVFMPDAGPTCTGIETSAVVRMRQTVQMARGAEVHVLTLLVPNMPGVGVLKVVGDAQPGDTVLVSVRVL